jgi:predicted ATPase
MNNSSEQVTLISPHRTIEKVRALTADDLLTVTVPVQDADTLVPLQQLSIEGLLSFGQKTDFEFGRLNLLVGPNGSGKSNLLSCIRILRLAPFDIQEAFNDSGFEEWLYKGDSSRGPSAYLEINANPIGNYERILHRFVFSLQQNSRVGLEEVISSSEESEQKQIYFIGSYHAGGTLTIVGTRQRRKNRDLSDAEYNPFASILSQIRDVGQYPEITHLSGLYAQFRIYSEWTFGRNSNLREATPTNRTTTILSEAMDDLALTLNGLERTSAHDAIRRLLRELKETYVDYITRVLFGRVGLELIESPFEKPLPAMRLSDGTLRFLALAAILFQLQPPPVI